MLPLSYLRTACPMARARKNTLDEESLHDAPATAGTMAGGWRKLLEEESEHQWLAMGAFLAFIIFGALAIGATEHFVGDRVVQSDAWHSDSLVIEIAYHTNNESYTALIFTPGSNGGYAFGTEFVGDGEGTVYWSSQTGDDFVSDINFLKTMPDGEILFSVDDATMGSSANNALYAIQDHLMIKYEYPLDNGEFGILDVAELDGEDGTQRLSLTQEDANTSLRGVVGMMPTLPMSTSSGVRWNAVEAYEPGLWMALGSHMGAAGADGSSPATPLARPALGWITWDGTNSTPVLRNVQVFSEGVLNSFARSGDVVIVGGTKESLVVHADDDVESIQLGCEGVVSDGDDAVWFIPPQGSPTLSTFENGELETHVLSRPVPIEAMAAGSQGDFIHVHGTDGDGNPMQWSIDVTADGSIESGRGFLNLLFLLTGGILLAMMLWHAIEQLLGVE